MKAKKGLWILLKDDLTPFTKKELDDTLKGWPIKELVIKTRSDRIGELENAMIIDGNSEKYLVDNFSTYTSRKSLNENSPVQIVIREGIKRYNITQCHSGLTPRRASGYDYDDWI